MSSDRRVHVIASGRVQGVFFRQSTRREADRIGVHGWVRNLSDGRVEAEFEGSSARIAEMIEWCHHGPSSALVTNVLVTDKPTVGARGFVVHRDSDPTDLAATEPPS